jgi:pimeloyl-ACP methyl ester carboxylesterase
MLHIDVAGYRMPYIEVGQGAPVVLLHGSMSDFRVWSPVLGPLSRHFRVIAPSLRHFFPEHWDGVGDTFTIAQHTTDIIAFVERMGAPVHLVGHSRGGYLAFRVAQQRPELLTSLVLAEPGGDLDASLQPVDEPVLPPLRDVFVAARDRIATGDIDGGLELFIDAIDGDGVWNRLAPAIREELRDNAFTLLGQVNEQRKPYALADTRAIRTPTLLIEGARTKPASARNVRVLAAHISGAQRVTIPNASHMMFGQQPQACAAAIVEFVTRAAAS